MVDQVDHRDVFLDPRSFLARPFTRTRLVPYLFQTVLHLLAVNSFSFRVWPVFC